jgi:hypothetical protein
MSQFAEDAGADVRLLHQFIQDFYDAFSRDGLEASGYFREPAIFIGTRSVISLRTRAAAAAFMLELRRSLVARGYARSDPRHRSLRLLAPSTALYSSVSVRLRADGTEMDRVGYTHLIIQDSLGWGILSAIATDPAVAARAENDAGATIPP